MNTVDQQPGIEIKKETGEFLALTDIQDSTVKKIAKLGAEVELYSSARTRAEKKKRPVPFEIAADPFPLPEEVRKNLPIYGEAIVAYYLACDCLYERLEEGSRWKKYLDHSKPDYVLAMSKRQRGRHHIFLRPDFVLTENGVTTTEIETSPFGLPLAHFLNDGYQNAGRKTAVDAEILIKHFIESLGLNKGPTKKIDFIITPNTQNYAGQFAYLAKTLCAHGIDAKVVFANEIDPQEIESAEHPKYRGFYLHEALKNQDIQKLLETSDNMYPPCKPHMEEKAIMALLFEPEFEAYFREKLGTHYDILRKIFPPTFVIDRNHIPKNFPEKLQSWNEVAQLPSGKRKYVIKSSGFNPKSSWGKSVVFLHKISKDACEKLIEEALKSEGVFVIQEFQKGAIFSQIFFDFETETAKIMKGKVRVTPYYAVSTGEMLTVKATLCANTDYIHAMLDSINSPVI